MKLFKMTNGTNVVFFEAYDAKEATEKAVKYADHSKAVRIDEIKERIAFTRIKNDVNGNPRYVVHHLDLLSESEYQSFNTNGVITPNQIGSVVKKQEERYKLALKKARTIGGRKFHNKQYGGGIVFQSYNTTDLEKSILKLKETC